MPIALLNRLPKHPALRPDLFPRRTPAFSRQLRRLKLLRSQFVERLWVEPEDESKILPREECFRMSVEDSQSQAREGGYAVLVAHHLVEHYPANLDLETVLMIVRRWLAIDSFATGGIEGAWRSAIRDEDVSVFQYGRCVAILRTDGRGRRDCIALDRPSRAMPRRKDVATRR